MGNCGCNHISIVFGNVINHWFKNNPSIIRGLYKANNDLDGFLFADKPKRDLILKQIEYEKQERIKNMSVDEKMEYLKQKRLL